MRWLDLLNPLKRVTNRAAADRYRGEPYVLAGDVYSVAPRVGQAGWTWYTGSAAWLYRVVLEQVLEFQPQHGELKLKPVVPSDPSRPRRGRATYSPQDECVSPTHDTR
jgi:cyclic beta-1,2-glucan synthetase